MSVSGSPEGGNQPPKKKRYQEENESVVESVADEVLTPVADALGGCLLRPIIWIATLPIRLMLRIIEAIFD